MDRKEKNMAIRNICKFEDEVLRKKSKTVVDFNQKLWDLLDDMAETMYKNEGVGLAAPQVGILRRVVVIDIGEGLMELINPEFVSKEGEQINTEGCLSFPNEYGEVTRPTKVVVEALDREANPITVVGEELLAIALCHEIDHLNGVVFKDLATEIFDITDDEKKSRRKR